MIYIPNDSVNPYYNLAFEEYVLSNMDPGEDYVLLWQNAPAVIVGKFQNTIEEINTKFIKERGIKVVRRMSGGGAVYHDPGNLNFTFIVKRNPNKLLDFKEFTASIIETLKALGINAEFNSRNDLTIDGKKFSGNAQYVTKNRLLHHGTLLFNSNLDDLEKALNVSNDKIESKGIKSIRSRVTNISDYLKRDIDIQEFKTLLLKNIFAGGEIKTYYLNPEDKASINELVKTKYGTWEWNYGESPEYNLKRSKRFNSGKVELMLYVKDGIIRECRIYGDFFGMGDISDIEHLLTGRKFKEEDIRSVLAVLETVDIRHYFGGIALSELMELFC